MPSGRQRLQIRGDRLGGEGAGVGLGGVEEVGGDVDQVVLPAGRATAAIGLSGRHAPRIGRRHAAADATRSSTGSGSTAVDRGGAELLRLGDAEAAGGAGQQHAGARHQQVGQGGERRAGIARIDRPRLGQRRRCRLPSRYRPSELGGPGRPSRPALLRHIGIDALGEVVEQHVEPARRAGFRPACGCPARAAARRSPCSR